MQQKVGKLYTKINLQEPGSAFIAATGGTITTCGNDKIHTFTGPGTFTVCQIASLAHQKLTM